MKAELTAIIEVAPEGGLGHLPRDSRREWARTVEDAKNDLRSAIDLIVEDRRFDILRG